MARAPRWLALLGLLAGALLAGAPGLAKQVAEPDANLRRIAGAAATYFDGAKAYPPAVARTPAATCCEQQGHVCQPDATLWRDPTWTSLGFALEAAHQYQYELRAVGTGDDARFVARAYGDPKCNGKREIWEVAGRVVDGKAVTAPPKKLKVVTKTQCERVVRHMLDVMVAAAPAAQRRQAAAAIFGAAPRMVATCEGEAWSAGLVSCRLKAKDVAAVSACAQAFPLG